METFNQFVLGKGGVGKSVVACALAQRCLDLGLQVLLVQVNARDTHAALLGIPPVTSALSQAADRLWTVNLEPRMCLKEYLTMMAPIHAVADVVLRASMLETIVDFVPGLAELTMMGKIWFHAEEKQKDGSKRFDRIIVDLQSTGHGLKMLHIAKATKSLVKKGRLAQETARMQSLLSDPKKTCVHLVTLLDELPVQETLAAAQEIQNKGQIALGSLFVNRVQVVDEPAHDLPNTASPIEKEIFELREEEDKKEQQWLDILTSGLPRMPQVLLPEILTAHFGPTEIKELAGQIK